VHQLPRHAGARHRQRARTSCGPELVLHDRAGNRWARFWQGPSAAERRAALVDHDAQVKDLMNFLRQRINDGLRGSPIFVAGNVLTGDAKAGQAYFDGDGKCAQCHSTTGNLAGIGTRLDPINLQQRSSSRWPAAAAEAGRGPGALSTVTTVTVTPAAGAAISGTLVFMDDFIVTLRDANNVVRTVKRRARREGRQDESVSVPHRPARSHHRQADARRRGLPGDREMKRLLPLAAVVILGSIGLAGQAGQNAPAASRGSASIPPAC
jgi:hypothetical protein